MAELLFKAPLAKFEEGDEGQHDFITECLESKSNLQKKSSFQMAETGSTTQAVVKPVVNDNQSNYAHDKLESTIDEDIGAGNIKNAAGVFENFGEPFNGSLEDLVNTFDEKITSCFYNYRESVEKLAPVQIRTQEDIMNECQMWWTITGNFGNILPIDWSKSYACKLQMPSLHLHCDDNCNLEVSNEGIKYAPKEKCANLFNEANNMEEEAIANDLDMHSLILSGLDNEPLKTADEVIREIDDMIVQGSASDYSPISDNSEPGLCDSSIIIKQVNQPTFLLKKLNLLDVRQLNEVYLELELLIKDYSETLIAELALRDELEFQKELKNSFISLLLAIQNRRRQYHMEKKKGIRNVVKAAEPKYLTTVIPYHADGVPLDDHTLQVLIKILKAINEDSPVVPNLLTDYILKDELRTLLVTWCVIRKCEAFIIRTTQTLLNAN